MILRLAALFALAPLAAAASTCRDTSFEGTPYTICEVTAAEDVRIFHSGPNGPLAGFNAVNDALKAEGKTLGFAMNGGMYHRDLSPVGLLVENGQEQAPIVTRDGPGNFGLLPNGVFCIDDRFRVVESRSFDANRPSCRYATQSGPMLVLDGALHPRLDPGGTSLHIRNGVGVTADGSRAVFAITNRPVNFHSFARFFRDALGLSDALYLDGSISRLYAPALGRSDIGFPMGPIVGAVVPAG